MWKIKMDDGHKTEISMKFNDNNILSYEFSSLEYYAGIL